MSAKKIIETTTAPKPVGPYSQAVTAGPFTFCSGQIALRPEDGTMVKGDVREEALQVLRNIEAVLKAANLKMSDIVKTTIFLTSMQDFAAVNEVYGQFFKTEPPARSTFAVAGLPKDAKVEIEVTAFRAG
jgi:2-iminobutanoate/2-iminopropanoate deaminase